MLVTDAHASTVHACIGLVLKSMLSHELSTKDLMQMSDHLVLSLS